MTIIRKKKFQIELLPSAEPIPYMFKPLNRVCKEKLNIFLKLHILDEIYFVNCIIKNDDETFRVLFQTEPSNTYNLEMSNLDNEIKEKLKKNALNVFDEFDNKFIRDNFKCSLFELNSFLSKIGLEFCELSQ